MVNRWVAPIGASRPGAAHRRSGRPCQDAVLCRELRGVDGQPVMLMAVADGHGGRRYRRSEVGSRLACEAAQAAVEGALAARPLAEGNGSWSRWLERDLPEAIARRWLEAVEAHWHSDPGEGGFEPLLYGSTLGLVVMTPRWWGHTGLGDWDLVRVEADGRARLLQEETEPTATGEATCSLCQPRAAALFAPRSALHPITAADGDVALVLCTDGIRKSCATDGDFLTLAAWLARCGAGSEPEGAGTLQAALDRISREGSGDDVTVAIGCIGSLGEGSPEPPPAALAKAASPAAAQAAPTQGHRPAIGRAVAIALTLAAAGGAWLALVWPRSAPPLQATSTSPGLRAARAEVERLCGQPSAIPLELRRRRELFVALRQGRRDPARLKAEAASDPLAALIAADLPVAGPGIPPQPRRSLQALGACPALLEALSRQWAATPAAPTP
ncbi:MAG: protein phosphatase 2C domain-containing protein [Cyanobium sp. CZS 25K]|nr:protein phosphatase 2C domain-containing protein [Cyanobium sp. CZS25K]